LDGKLNSQTLDYANDDNFVAVLPAQLDYFTRTQDKEHKRAEENKYHRFNHKAYIKQKQEEMEIYKEELD